MVFKFNERLLIISGLGVSLFIILFNLLAITYFGIEMTSTVFPFLSAPASIVIFANWYLTTYKPSKTEYHIYDGKMVIVDGNNNKEILWKDVKKLDWHQTKWKTSLIVITKDTRIEVNPFLKDFQAFLNLLLERTKGYSDSTEIPLHLKFQQRKR